MSAQAHTKNMIVVDIALTILSVLSISRDDIKRYTLCMGCSEKK